MTDASRLTAVLSDGTETTLGKLCLGGPLALVFLRHLGCIFCREIVAQLVDQAPNENIVLVAMAEPEAAAEFLRQIESPHRMICDPDRLLYKAFDLARGSVGQMVGPTVLRKGFSAFRAGHRPSKPIGDPWQLPGVFVLDSRAKIVWSRRASDAADTPTPAEIVAILKAQTA